MSIFEQYNLNNFVQKLLPARIINILEENKNKVVNTST